MKLINNMALVFYTDNLAEGFGGKAKGPLIFIRPQYKADVGIHNHELEHVKQWWFPVLMGGVVALLLRFGAMSDLWPFALMIGAVAHPLMYTFVPSYRLKCEVNAYKEQMRVTGQIEPPEWIINALATKYNLTYSVEYIKTKM